MKMKRKIAYVRERDRKGIRDEKCLKGMNTKQKIEKKNAIEIELIYRELF